VTLPPYIFAIDPAAARPHAFALLELVGGVYHLESCGWIVDVPGIRAVLEELASAGAFPRLIEDQVLYSPKTAASVIKLAHAAGAIEYALGGGFEWVTPTAWKRSVPKPKRRGDEYRVETAIRALLPCSKTLEKETRKCTRWRDTLDLIDATGIALWKAEQIKSQL